MASRPEDEDSKPTVVLDLESLKAQNDRDDEDVLGEITENLEFNVSQDPSEEAKTPPRRPDILLFDLASNYFEKNAAAFPREFSYTVLKDLAALNQKLRQEEAAIIVFNYNAAPKGVNQLCAQIKNKFPKAKTLIIAKNLSEQKAKGHQKTKSGANAYLSSPFGAEAFKNKLNEILNSRRPE